MRTLNLRRPRIAAAAAPNKMVIGGAGTSVPLLVPPEELDELLEPLEELEDEELELDEDELLDEEELVLLVILPELLPLVDMPLVLPPELEELDEDELEELDDDELLDEEPLLEEEPLLDPPEEVLEPCPPDDEP